MTPGATIPGATPPGATTSGTFLLGLGAQKAGTAWMHRYLESSPRCDPGFRKEYHVWDALDLPSGRVVRERIEKQGGDRARFLADPDAYVDYFAGLLGRDGVRLTADITPSYAGLSVERLAGIRAAFEQRGVRPVAVYLMRDPVERVWSAVRMDVRRSGNTDDRAVEARLRTIADGDQYDRRTRYDLTMASADAAFDGAVFYGFYERLFDVSTLEELCAFLGIDFVEPDFGRQVNVSPKEDGDLADDTVRGLVARFAPVYEAVALRFPEVDLPSLWPSARYL
jgi:hypothetical protein